MKLPISPAVLTIFLVGTQFVNLAAQQTGSLPPYVPGEQLSGVIRVWGHVFFKKVMEDWEAGFRKFHPGVQFENNLVSSAAATGALFTRTAEIGVVGREIRPLEVAGYQRVMKSKPLGLEVMTGAYANADKSIALAIFVNAANPLAKLTYQKLDAIFGSEHLRGKANIRTWGELGLTGEWAGQPIHVYIGELDAAPAFLFSQTVMKGSLLWNPDLTHFDDVEKEGKTYEAGQRIVDALADARYGIALSGAGYRIAAVKPVSISVEDEGPFVSPYIEHVKDRSYPLSRSAWIYVNRTLGRPVEPKTREFLLYILSREGQEAVVREGEYLPLTPAKVSEQRHKIE
jgi:phosphate transport system substrate-binding protein